MHILIYTTILTASLLVLLMMLWHISTAHLIDNYSMPEEWYREFIAAQFPGWRIWLWALLFFMVRDFRKSEGKVEDGEQWKQRGLEEGR